MRSPRKVFAERIRQLGDESKRFVDMTARVQVYRRGADGLPYAAERLPEIYGGVWDTWARRYDRIGVALDLSVHPGQVRLLQAFDDPTRRRTLALGSQGGGKTEGVVTTAVLLALWHAGKTGGVVAPTRPRIKVVWRKFLKAIPPHWVREIRPGDGEIILTNGSLVQFFAAKKQAKNAGSPFAGNDWHWAVEEEQQDMDDDACEEVDARGRINPDFKVFSSATNEPYGSFQRRVKEYESNPSRKVVRFTGPENVFTPLAHWENLRVNWDAESYQRKILCEDVPLDGRVYPAFRMAENVRPAPPPSAVGRSVDITPSVTNAVYQRPYQYVVGVDFGVRVCASVILQCYRAPGDTADVPKDRQWWIVDEVITEHKTPDWHASQLLEWFGGSARNFIAITGQDSNSRDPDKSDFVLFRERGINLTRATYAKRIAVTHRIAMVNALLHAADGRRRLFVDCDVNGRVKAKKTIDSFEGMRLNASDRPEHFGKGTKGGEDLTHYTDALGYALFPFESFRGAPQPIGPGTTDEEVRKRLADRWV